MLFHLLGQVMTKHRPSGTLYLKNQIPVTKTCYICGPYFHWGKYGNKNLIEYEKMALVNMLDVKFQVHLGSNKDL